jgi:hypothetical protein
LKSFTIVIRQLAKKYRKREKTMSDLVLLILMILGFSFAVFTMKKNFLIYVILLVLFLGILGTVGFRYFTNPLFRLSVNLKFNTTKQHDDLTNKNIPPLPLPENTVFEYRYSDNGARYYTLLGKNEIINYYKGISDKDSFINNQDSTSEKEKCKFDYKNVPFIISIEKSINQDGNYIYIDSNTK